jgi:hypothetical protein
LAGHAAPGQFGLLAVIEPHVAVDVQRAGQLGVGREPLLGKQSGPFLRQVSLAELSRLVAQAADLGHAIQSQEFSQLARRFVLQSFDRLDAAQRHVGRQCDHLERRVITVQRGEGLFQVLKQSVGRQGGQRTEHSPEANIAAIFKSGRRAFEHAQCRQDPFFRPRTSHPHFRRPIGHASLGLVGDRLPRHGRLRSRRFP